jgi:ornithine cyclodeaminase/alanine dehydrogenase-like protein (mu-crystallin family)
MSPSPPIAPLATASANTIQYGSYDSSTQQASVSWSFNISNATTVSVSNTNILGVYNNNDYQNLPIVNGVITVIGYTTNGLIPSIEFYVVNDVPYYQPSYVYLPFTATQYVA